MAEKGKKDPIQSTNIEKPVHHSKKDNAGVKEPSLEEKVMAVDTSAAVKADALIGKVIAERYKVTARIGAGGMGAVYKARQVGMDRSVGIKVMLREYTQDERIVKRFKVEALAVSRLNHPNTVRIYDFGQMDTGDLYIAMEFLDGKPLDSVLDQTGPMSVNTALHIIKQLASSLAEAHSKGIVHRDLKPENIFLVTVGNDPYFVKVLDFGVAKLKEGDKRLGTLTQTGAIFGTPKYMAPEQCRGKEVDGRTDIYAMGVILYQLLTGQVPFSGDSPLAIMLQHVQNKPKPPTLLKPELDIPNEVEEIVMKCLEKDPNARYQSAGEFLAAISAAEAMLGNRYAHVVYVEPSVRDARKKAARSEAPTVYDTGYMAEKGGARKSNKWLIMALVLVVAAGTGGIYWAYTAKHKRRHVRTRTVVVPREKTVIKPVIVEKPPQEVTVHLDTTPTGAVVRIDGKDVGRTPFKGMYKRSAKVIQVTLDKKGYKPKTIAVNLGESAFIRTQLQRMPAATRRPKRVHRPRRASDKPKALPVKKPKNKGPKKVGDLKSVF